MSSKKDKVLSSVLALMEATDEDLPWLHELPIRMLEDMERALKRKESKACQR